MHLTKLRMESLKSHIFAVYNGWVSRYKIDRLHNNRLVEEECR